MIVGGIIKASVFAYKQSMIHCKHCKGNGPCQCQFGCSGGRKCFAFFEDRTCASCRSEGIKGSLFQCRECPNCDLCQTCYDRLSHPEHDFIEFQRKGATPIFHEAQGKPKVAKITHLPPAQSLHSSLVVKPSAPVQPARPVQVVVPAKIVQPAAKPVQAVPAKIVQPAKPLQAVPAKVVQPAKPVQPVQVIQPVHVMSVQPAQLRFSAPNLHSNQKPTLSQPAYDSMRHSAPNLSGKKFRCDLCHSVGDRSSHLKCASCPSFDLCQACYDRNVHGHHGFVKYANADGSGQVFLPPKGRSNDSSVHHSVVCDGCGEDGIVGNRYKCSQCPPSYDLCSTCWARGTHGHHAFLRYTSPNATPFLEAPYAVDTSSSSSSSVISRPVHALVMCDVCKTDNILGARYNCQVCTGFDACEACYQKAKHGHHTHPFLRYDRPGASPLFLRAQCTSKTPGSARPTGSVSSSGSARISGALAGFVDKLADDLIDNAIEDAVENLAEDFGESLISSFTGGDDAGIFDC